MENTSALISGSQQLHNEVDTGFIKREVYVKSAAEYQKYLASVPTETIIAENQTQGDIFLRSPETTQKLQTVIAKLPGGYDTDTFAITHKLLVLGGDMYKSHSDIKDCRNSANKLIEKGKINREDYLELITDIDREDVVNQYTSVPDEERGRIQSFALLLRDTLDNGFFDKFDLSSKAHLSGIISAVYNLHKARGGEIDDNMFRRILLGIENDISNAVGSTENLVDDYLMGDVPVNKTSLINLFQKIALATLPISDSYHPERVGEKIQLYLGFLERSGKYTKDGMDKLKEACIKFGFEPPFTKADEEIIYVSNVNRSHPYSNDEAVERQRVYNGLSAAALTMGIDPVTGLNLALTVLPGGWDKEIGADTPLNEDIAYHTALTNVHEQIHNVSDLRDVDSDWLHMVNEMLTDTGAVIFMLDVEAEDFKNFKRGEKYWVASGYGNLIHLARDLVIQDLMTVDDLRRFALKQDPEGFVSLLIENVSKHKKEADFVHLLQEKNLIPPRKKSERDKLLTYYNADPRGFLEKEMQRQFNMMHSLYVNPYPGYYQVGMVQALNRKFSDYLDIMVEAHGGAESGVKKSETNLNLLYDPKDRLFTDEAVDVFYEMFKMSAETNSKDHLAYGLINEQSLLNRIEGIEFKSPDPRFNPTKEQTVLMFRGFNTMVNMSNITLENFPGWDTPEFGDAQFGVLNKMINLVIPDLINTLERNWGKFNEGFTQQDMLNLIATVAPAFMKTILYDTPHGKLEDLAKLVISHLDAITSPLETNEEVRVTPSKAQIGYWGEIVNIVPVAA